MRNTELQDEQALITDKVKSVRERKKSRYFLGF